MLAVITAAGSDAAAPAKALRPVSPSTVVMDFPEALGPMQRPAVEFDHARHTAALEREGCTACHQLTDRVLDPRLTGTVDVAGRDPLIDAYHGTCMGCHEQRTASSLASGPATCGGCHVRQPEGASQRVAMRFDLSLHGRHSLAYEDKCESCHHVYDEELDKLVYTKGTEEACGPCHGPVDVERTLSLANASHRSCVSCHLERAREQLAGGPVHCVGCHDAEQRQAIRKLEVVPRLQRGQPDTAWIAAKEATGMAVAFNHAKHEPLAGSCSSCHHRTLKPCRNCHTLAGAPEGGRLSLAQAHHLNGTDPSCVGCHAAQSSKPECAGCHRALAQPPGEAACAVCHSGPRAASLADDSPPPELHPVELGPLPALSDDFPETVVIDRLMDRYQASTLPHAKIVARLDASVRGSSLAGRFHGSTETLCSGCHHHSPVDVRPPACRSCHAATDEATSDRPGIKVAYHRQCVGCHIAMGIAKQGCTDCHAAKEVQS
jgi:hypothetical protein